MSALVYKVIKPRRLNAQAMRLELLNAMHKVGTGIKGDFEKTTATWKTPVEFEKQISLSGGPQVEIFTTNKIYGYVDQGTEPHPIAAKNAPFLVFKWGGPGSYKAKTSPGVIGSSGSSQSGTTQRFKSVMHPGTKARNFSKEIEKKWQPRFRKEMEATMSKVAKASGHAL